VLSELTWAFTHSPVSFLGAGDGFAGQGRVAGADEVSEARAELVVGEEARAALGVVHDGGLEPRPPSYQRAGQVSDVGEIFQHVGRDAAAGVADHHRAAEVQFEEGWRVGPGIQARDT
jgi:hypothetical protein